MILHHLFFFLLIWWSIATPVGECGTVTTIQLFMLLTYIAWIQNHLSVLKKKSNSTKSHHCSQQQASLLLDTVWLHSPYIHHKGTYEKSWLPESKIKPQTMCLGCVYFVKDNRELQKTWTTFSCWQCIKLYFWPNL